MRYLLVVLGLVIIGCVNTTEKPKNQETKEQTLNPSLSATDYSLLIKQLGSDDWETREKAQKALEDWPADKISEIEPSIKEAAEGADPEIRNRAAVALKVINVKKRVFAAGGFSDLLLKNYPNIYHDLATLNTNGKCELLTNISGISVRYETASNKDIANIIGEVLIDGYYELDKKEKRSILGISWQGYHGIVDTIDGSWVHDPILEAVPHIKKLLDDKDEEIRNYTIISLGRLGCKEFIPNLLELLKDEKLAEEASITFLFMNAKEAIPGLIKLLNDKNSFTRKEAISALGGLDAKEAIPKLIKILKDDNEDVRRETISSLSRMNAKEAIPDIQKCLKDTNGAVRSTAIHALSELNCKGAIPEIIKLLNDDEPQVQQEAVLALGLFGATDSAPALIKLLSDSSDSDVINVVIFTIRTLAAFKANESIPKLIGLLEPDVNNGIQREAAYALGKLKAKDAIPKLMGLLKDFDEDENVQCAAGFAVGELGVKEAIPILTQLMEIYKMQPEVFFALAKLNAKDAIPELTEFTNGEHDNYTCCAAMFALRMLGVKEALTETEKFLNSDDFDLKEDAILNCSLLDADEIVPKLLKFLKDDDKRIRGYAGIVLIELGAKDKVPKKVIEDIKSISQWFMMSYSNRARNALIKVAVETDKEEKK